MCAESSVRRALKDANGTTALRNNPYRPGDAARNGYFALGRSLVFLELGDDLS